MRCPRFGLSNTKHISFLLETNGKTSRHLTRKTFFKVHHAMLYWQEIWRCFNSFSCVQNKNRIFILRLGVDITIRIDWKYSVKIVKFYSKTRQFHNADVAVRSAEYFFYNCNGVWRWKRLCVHFLEFLHFSSFGRKFPAKRGAMGHFLTLYLVE